jgi:hypothetical protein
MNVDDTAVWQVDISEEHAVSTFSTYTLKVEKAHSPEMLVLISQIDNVTSLCNMQLSDTVY